MHCIVTGGNVKVLAKAVHSLSRIGDELYVEPQEDGSVQSVFRSLTTLEKTVEKCHIDLDKQKDRLTFTLHCKHGLLKTHNLSFQDSESLQAVFDKDSYANVFRAQPRLLVDTVVHFPPSLDEVTMSVSDERMWVRNHVEDEPEASKAMLTELCLASDEFDHFAAQAHNSVTFCLKELRGLLVFAESTGLPVSMYLDEPGSPVVLSVTDSVLEGNFVLATLSDDPSLRKNSSKGAHTAAPPPPDDFMNDDMDSYLIAMDTSIAPGPSNTGPPPPSLSGDTRSKRPAAVSHKARILIEEAEEEETDDLDRLPNKKFRSLFFGSVLPPSSQLSTQPMTSQEVLASDSEEEN
ncbi:cell cycle checkpoint control protein RAD9A isoform X4 [Haplochromis burtoni]|uniref:cell cycle checkpoint control protein RAD9A isoform X4 n=1 Tax=Haplochromis burtoni TaxID=8153 RepID=UPI001C2D0301|nr:cell cycle checkpoint control protein RAD9A isoform X4 [Haplochromis burtoni]